MNRLKEARKKAGLTQKEVAEMAGIAERGYQNYELGSNTPKVNIALKLAKVVDCPVEYLFDTSNNQA